MTTIGFVGLGEMGGRIAGRLLASGKTVYGTNRTTSKAAALVDRGLVWCEAPRDVAEAAEVIFSMVTDDAALAAITTGPDGLLAGLAPGKVYVDMSTVGPQASRQLAERVRTCGAEMLDAPVSGGIPAAEDGSLAIMVGGSEEAFARVAPLLREFGRTVTYVGANGQGLLLKFAVNISLGVQILALGEGVPRAERPRIDPRPAVDVAAESWFDVQLMQPDIRLALGAARPLDVALPSAAFADELLTTARALGCSHRDITALFEVLAEPHETRAPVDFGHEH
jgi:3-hydroxyisobutyrate dehydrogenase-like beta-hydroxyacid dehydrogenase